MPGKVRALLVAEGETVARGTTLLLLEAMTGGACDANGFFGPLLGREATEKSQV